MIFRNDENVINRIKNKYRSSILNIQQVTFKLLQIDFADAPYPIQFQGGRWVKSEQPQGSYILGHIFTIDNKNYIVNEDGYYTLEDPEGFSISSLVFPYQENVYLTYQVDLEVISKQEVTTATFDLPEDYNSYDYIKQQKKSISLNDNLFGYNVANITVDNVAYELKSVDIEIDASSVFENQAGTQLIVGETERLNVSYIGEFSSLKYKGVYINQSTIQNTGSKEVIITYYYKKQEV